MKAYFIGIGGSGVSALAQYYLYHGWEVSGSDSAPSEITNQLAEKGAQVHTGDPRSDRIPEDVDLVVYSAAIPDNHPELARAGQLFHEQPRVLRVLSYSEALGELTQRHTTIAVTGTHGKGTTTGMLSRALIDAGFDPTVICGTQLPYLGDANFRSGDSRWLLIEADEAYASFLHYAPYCAVIVNIDFDHPEYYRDIHHTRNTFAAFAERITSNGILVANGDDHNARYVGEGLRRSRPDITLHYFPQQEHDRETVQEALTLPGAQYIEDGTAALAVSRALGIADTTSVPAIGAYQTAARRLQREDITLDGKTITVISDYAHHPAEVIATLDTISQLYPERSIHVIFQPHQYTRFRQLFDSFCKAFAAVAADSIIVTDVYRVAGRDTDAVVQQVMQEGSPQDLARCISQHRRTARREGAVAYHPFRVTELAQTIRKNTEDNAVVVCMGAGDIHEVFRALTAPATTKYHR